MRRAWPGACPCIPRGAVSLSFGREGPQSLLQELGLQRRRLRPLHLHLQTRGVVASSPLTGSCLLSHPAPSHFHNSFSHGHKHWSRSTSLLAKHSPNSVTRGWAALPLGTLFSANASLEALVGMNGGNRLTTLPLKPPPHS